MGLNSPRAANQNPAAALVTQVSQDETGGGIITSVARPDSNSASLDGSDDETEKDIRNAQANQSSGGFCACFSCLWSCCSGPKKPESIPMTNQSDNNSTYKPASKPAAKNKKQEERSSAKLLSSDGGNGQSMTTGNGTHNNNEESISSSTEYEVQLLPPVASQDKGKKCLVLDLDETLVHSSFKPIPKPDFIIPVEIDRVVHHVYVLKRPYVDEFLLRASKCYEIVIFTASLAKYADPLLDKLDIHKVIRHRLFRESCVIHGTAYVKDMRRIGRKLKDSIIVDNSPPSYLFQPTNAVPITSWFDDQSDTQLLDFCPVIETTMKDIDDVRKLLDANNKSFRWLCNQANQPLSKYTVRNDKR